MTYRYTSLDAAQSSVFPIEAMPRPQRILKPRQPGITEGQGKYYHGIRVDQIVRKRAEEVAAAKAARKSTRGTRPPKVRSPSQQLRRLERALPKRKTETARARIRAQIAKLKDELGQ